MKFTELNLHPDLLKGIEKAGYVDCTPVQEQVLKASLDGQDLYVQSQTGTGKTAAFLISIIQELLSNADKNKKALIMVPTRELAVQVEEEAKTLCSGSKLKCASFYGGVGYGKQTELLKKNIDILVGTPGRLIDLQESGAMDLSKVGYLVVDEADRMFDMGFYPELRKLIKVLPSQKDRQTMLFSATLNTYVKNLAWEYTENAKEIEIEPENITVEEIAQELIHVSSDDKMKLLLGILKRENPESVIIFCNTKRSCEVIAKRLQINQINADFIIGDLPQATRLKVLNLFKEGKLSCLVATDVAARGIDVSDLAMVINYDLPNESENYVHRIGRTARAGKSGKAYTFCSEQDVYNLPAIEKYIELTIPSTVAFEDMFEEDKSKDIYIKTGNYHDEEKSNSKSYKSNRGNSKKGKAEYKSSGKKGSYSDKENYKNKDYKKKDSYKDKKSQGKKSQSICEQQDLSNLSFEERMKLYKEKYGQQSVSLSTSAKKNDKNNAKKQGSKPVTNSDKKISLLDKIKKFFTRKN
jgi:ATP-dependent RNA helicase RhlB